MKAFPLDVTTDASGNGSVTFRATKASVIFRVQKIVATMGAVSSGRASLFKNGTFLTAMPIAARMEATGPEDLHTSEYLTGQIENGPMSTLVNWVFYYDEIPDNP